MGGNRAAGSWNLWPGRSRQVRTRSAGEQLSVLAPHELASSHTGSSRDETGRFGHVGPNCEVRQATTTRLPAELECGARPHARFERATDAQVGSGKVQVNNYFYRSRHI